MSDFVSSGFVLAQPARDHASERAPVTALRLVWRTCLTRQALPDLTPRELADIGVSATEAVAEAARLPWDIGPRQPNRGILASIQQVWERARAIRLLARQTAL